MKKIFLITIFSFLMFECTNKKPEIKKTLIGQKLDTLKYEYKGFNNGLSMGLISDNRFYYKDYWYGCTGGGENKIFHGKYKIVNNILTLKADSAIVESTPFDSHFNPEVKTIYKIDDSLKFKKQYHFFKWNNTSYLLSNENNTLSFDNDFQKFVNYYNSGFEPESHGRYLYRDIDSIKLNEKLDKTQLPLKWRNRLFDEEVVVKISDIKKMAKRMGYEDNELLKIIINKGKSSKIYKGLRFTDQQNNIELVIDSIAENFSFGEMYNDYKIKIGIELRTKWNKTQTK